ncbi:hypothetical protein SAY87_018540 [Trapa incisa]|uniref:Protein FAR1-RELATED SEQUENCE n=1 Tax=Trapa incisa TaxID=236973 RepID=A0AAN7QX47_9MYRT|nr:hypothetical protein SAY87_018540 [Trapa incisa]
MNCSMPRRCSTSEGDDLIRMEAEVVDTDGGGGESQESKNDGSDQTELLVVTENAYDREISALENDSSSKPSVGMKFESEDAAKNFYDAYSRHVGFSTYVGKFSRSKPDGPIVSWDFACSREVFKRKNIESCNAMIRVERNDTEYWIVTKFVEEHNHSIITPTRFHHLRPRRHFAGTAKSGNESLYVANDAHVPPDSNLAPHEPNRIMSMDSHVGINHPILTFGPLFPPINYAIPGSQRRTLGHDAQNLLNYFQKMQAENPGFFYAIQLDNDNCMTNVFWADARSRAAYAHFGDAVIFDTTYRPNHYQVPFAPFTGINHHGQMILFGCALLLDESEASFTWLFRTWLSAMNGKPPVSITTDQDRAIKATVTKVLPKTRHCICKWHILREGQERLAQIYLAHPSFYGDLYSCINFSETIEDFETSWSSILDKYDAHNNEWLQAVYTARMQWAPVYFHGTFFAAISSNHGVGSFFDGYVNQQTTVPMFFKQYERALEQSLEKEIEADYDTLYTTPVLKTPSPMEQQAANIYSKKIFGKFQEELVETFVYTANKIEGAGVVSKFRVAKYEHDDKAFVVTLDVSEMKASCSCQMFEYSGILCRHILTVFTVTNVLTLPAQYLLKRWSQNAKCGPGFEEQTADAHSIGTLTKRFNSLCQGVIKYAEEGSVALETYNVAFNSLKEGLKNIMASKKNILKFVPPGDCHHKSFSSVTEAVPPALWPWQETAVPRFNLNDAGLPVTDLNQPSMSPVSFHCDNPVVLTCLKSMTWDFEANSSTPASKVALIRLKLQDYSKNPPGVTEVQFRLTRVTLEPMLKSMAYISQQLSVPANRVAVINLKLQDTKTSSGETEVKFQVSRETLAQMLSSMACIRGQL